MQKSEIEEKVTNILSKNGIFQDEPLPKRPHVAFNELVDLIRKMWVKGLLAGMMLGILLSISVIATLWLNGQPAVTPTVQDVDNVASDTLTFNHDYVRDSLPTHRSLMPNTLNKTHTPQ